MSLHINMTEDAERRIRSQRMGNLIVAWLTAILSMSLLGVMLYIAAVVIPAVEKPEVSAYQVNEELAPPSDRPTTPERSLTRQASVAPSSQSIIQTTAVTDIAVATVDVPMPVGEISPTSEIGLVATLGDDGGTKGEGFGDPDASGSALEGTFYDLKQLNDGTSTGMSLKAATLILSEFVNKRWDKRLLDKYMKSPHKLYASQFYIPTQPAANAPKAFQMEDKSKGSLWCAVYRGTVVAPKTGEFRFVGAGDNALVVRFNNEHVFDFGIEQIVIAQRNDLKGKEGDWYKTMAGKSTNNTIKKAIVDGKVNALPMTFYEYSTADYWTKTLGGLAAGKTFKVEAGKKYPIEIMISELPGHYFSAMLLIEEMGLKPQRTDQKTGAPILPLFRTNYAVPDSKKLKGAGKEIVPFDPIGLIWRTVKE